MEIGQRVVYTPQYYRESKDYMKKGNLASNDEGIVVAYWPKCGFRGVEEMYTVKFDRVGKKVVNAKNLSVKREEKRRMKDVRVQFNVNSRQASGGMDYLYKSVIDVSRGDIVLVDTKYGASLARVTRVDEAKDSVVGNYKMILAVVDVDKLTELNANMAAKEREEEQKLFGLKREIENLRGKIECHSTMLESEKSDLERLEKKYKISKGEIYAKAYGADFDGIGILICRQ